MMNILIFDLHDNLNQLLTKLEKIKNISIFFAFDETELSTMIKQIQPEILFVKSGSIDPFLYNFLKEKNMKIYSIDDPQSFDLPCAF